MGGIERVEIDFATGKVFVHGHTETQHPRGKTLPTAVYQSPYPTRLDRSGRKSAIKEIGVPAGTIDSLRPLMQTIFSYHGVDDFSYWEELTEKALYEPGEACILLDQSNRGPLEAAKAVLEAEPQTKRMMDFGNVSPQSKGYITTQLAWYILGHYPEESQKRWQSQIEEYEQNLQKERV